MEQPSVSRHPFAVGGWVNQTARIVNAIELETRYIARIRPTNCLLLLASADAKGLVRDCASTENIRLLGVEAYRILGDGRVQPGIEYSNIRFGRVENVGGQMIHDLLNSGTLAVEFGYADPRFGSISAGMGTRFLAIWRPVGGLRGAAMVAIGGPLVTLEQGFLWAGSLLCGSKRIDRQSLTLVAARARVRLG